MPAAIPIDISAEDAPALRAYLDAHTVRGPGCWEWTGLKATSGRARMPYDGHTVSAYRVAYALAHGGYLRPGILVCHACDNPGCVRPDHLWLGTHRDNNRDASQKERCMHTLSRRDVHALRVYAFHLADTGLSRTQAAGIAAERFSVSWRYACMLTRGTARADVPGPILDVPTHRSAAA
ncbi:MAG: HNH endonuclease signature motif containing protein [Thermoleophilia bacterium]